MVANAGGMLIGSVEDASTEDWRRMVDGSHQHCNQPIGVEMGKLNQVANGVWVRQSEWVLTNSIAVRGEDGLILIDPGIDGSELN